ncbi:hypothetical protein MTO96_030693 [Rhipicephalus appendiculatus]
MLQTGTVRDSQASLIGRSASREHACARSPTGNIRCCRLGRYEIRKHLSSAARLPENTLARAPQQGISDAADWDGTRFASISHRPLGFPRTRLRALSNREYPMLQTGTVRDSQASLIGRSASREHACARSPTGNIRCCRLGRYEIRKHLSSAARLPENTLARALPNREYPMLQTGTVRDSQASLIGRSASREHACARSPTGNIRCCRLGRYEIRKRPSSAARRRNRYHCRILSYGTLVVDLVSELSATASHERASETQVFFLFSLINQANLISLFF